MNVALIGYGKNGRMVEDVCRAQTDIRIAGIVDEGHLPSLSRVASPDVAIDFSHPDNLLALLAAALEMQVPLVLGTTGFLRRRRSPSARRRGKSRSCARRTSPWA